MALVLAKLFMRQISQTQNEDQTGISLWTLADIEKAQAKQKALDLELQQLNAARPEDVRMADNEDDDEYGDLGFSDRALGEMDLDV